MRETKKRYKSMNEKMNDQALHFEILINRLRPDLLPSNLEKPLDGAIVRADVRRVEESNVAKNILIEKGIIRDPTEPTAVLDQITGTQPLQKPEKKLVKAATIHKPDL